MLLLIDYFFWSINEASLLPLAVSNTSSEAAKSISDWAEEFLNIDSSQITKRYANIQLDNDNDELDEQDLVEEEATKREVVEEKVQEEKKRDEMEEELFDFVIEVPSGESPKKLSWEDDRELKEDDFEEFGGLQVIDAEFEDSLLPTEEEFKAIQAKNFKQ